MLTALQIKQWHEPIVASISAQAVSALESGQVIFLPDLAFPLLSHEQDFLSDCYADPKNKNISYDSNKNNLQGVVCNTYELTLFKTMMHRYANQTKLLLTNLFPGYADSVIQARTSYRPVEIAGRKAPSYRKDDTRLHVDSFPATPTGGRRILRVFTNVNPNSKPRVWRLGSPFEEVVNTFYNYLRKPMIGSAAMLAAMKITKSKRTAYDHYMLQLHNKMKADLHYQKTVTQQEVQFPASSSWIVFTDQVSHAAMAGQFTFEQTFYLPPESLSEPSKSPLKVLEKKLGIGLLY